jgi:hypothetical protein
MPFMLSAGPKDERIAHTELRGVVAQTELLGIGAEDDHRHGCPWGGMQRQTESETLLARCSTRSEIWWLAGLATAIIGAAWNYGASRFFTWGGARR